MPYTPYHFGPSGFMGLLFRRWIDPAVFVIVNVLIDVEVLADNYFQPGWPAHRLWHFHTLLVGSCAGAVLGLVIYFIKPVRILLERLMKLFGLDYRAKLWAMVLGGVFGAWLHVLIDSVYHYDVQTFWPMKKAYIYRIVTLGHQQTVHQWVKGTCIMFWLLFIALYILLVIKDYRKSKGTCAKRPQQL